MTARPCKILALVLASMIMLLFVSGQLLWADEPAPQSEAGAAAAEKRAPKTKEERLRDLQLEEAELTLRQREIMMKEKQADFGNMEALYNNKLVTLQELNDAKKDMEEAILVYEQAKLNLQMWELQSLKAAWHITIKDTIVKDEGDKKYMTITLVNTSEQVKLERTQLMIDAGIIEQVDTEVSPEINDIYVSIKEGENIISKPYEEYIPSLKLNDPVTLKFELIKDVEDVVVSMRYEEQEDRRNIHLKKVEPRITVVKAIKYYDENDKRKLQVTLRNSAVEGDAKAESGAEAESVATDDVSSSSEVPSTDVELGSLNDINNIYVAIRDEQRNIIGIPYEIRIPVLKYKGEKVYTFELKKDVNSVVIAMNYMKQEVEKTIYLEPDTRHISILSAEVSMLPDTPYIEPDRRGKREVTLELVNRSESEGIPSAEELEDITGSSIDATREIRNVYVSLKLNDVVVARPYEVMIPRLQYAKPQKLRFDLQKDAEEVTVALRYLGKQEEVKVYLQKVSPEDVVTMKSVGFAQEGTLGSSVEYDLSLQRLAEVERVFKLRVINLSDQFTYRFNDLQANTRVTQVKFTHDQAERKLSLRIYLPEEMDISLLDKPQGFYAAVLSEEEALKYEAERLTLNPEQLAQFKGGRVQLELIPKGLAKFELIAQSLYFPIKTDESVETLVTLKNIGTRNLENIRLTIALPSNKWNATIQPELVKKLDRQQETDIQIVITPPEDVGVGASELKLKADCEVDNIKVEASPKNLTIQVSSRANIIGTGILIGALILLVVGIAVLTIRLSRR